MKPSETPAIFVSLCHHFSRHLVYLDVRDVAEKVSDRFHASRTAGLSQIIFGFLATDSL